MREKRPRLIITFESMTDAIAMENFCKKHDLPGRLIPVPRAISTTCGMAWSAEPSDRKTLVNAIYADGGAQAGLRIAEFYEIEL